MSVASVLTVPQYGIVYPPVDELSTLSTIAATTLSSFQDTNGGKYDLTVGSSSNIRAEAVDNIFLGHGSTKQIVMSTAGVGGALTPYMTVGMSNARVTLVDKQAAGMTISTKDTYLGSAHFVEDSSKMTLSMPSLTDGFVVAPPVAMQSTLAVALDTALNQNLYVTGDTGMGGRLVTYGGIFTPNVAFYKSSSNNGAAQVGYTFKINSNDQLELIKYTFFGSNSSAVSKRVAVFGNAGLQSTDTSDVTYAASLITGASGTDAAGGGSNGTPGFSSGASSFTVSPDGSMYTTNRLAIGTSNIASNVALQVNGTVSANYFVAASNMTSPAFLTTSDERLKNVDAPIDGQAALDAIMSLSPLMYAWKADETQKLHAGFTAQGIARALPNAVQTAALGSMEDVLHIDNTALVAYLVAAVKELGSRLV
jgi:hypothetical protein